jgi:hypothetical protein
VLDRWDSISPTILQSSKHRLWDPLWAASICYVYMLAASSYNNTGSSDLHNYQKFIKDHSTKFTIVDEK